MLLGMRFPKRIETKDDIVGAAAAIGNFNRNNDRAVRDGPDFHAAAIGEREVFVTARALECRTLIRRCT